ncbi:MAG: DEAD/DEAH box helicase [Butyricicoccus pullicaecorum]|nr:DEAD/DEAH box helicase [Butyricicoccus pullicaecorum]
MRFQDLQIDPSIQKAIAEIGYETPTPIQEKAIPAVLAGRDLLACAQTGTGKTAAFAIPMLQRMGRPVQGEARPIRGLILTPTRELALQIYENLCQYGRYTGRISTVIFGGVSQNPQVEALKNGVDILVATPGRLWDLMGQNLIDIGAVECFVLDEADQMLDMGFINDVKRIIAFLPKKRQTLLFSATMPKEIAELAQTLLYKPERISIKPAATPVECIEQGVYFAEKQAKRELLKVILKERNLPQTLVFTRTKHGADRVARDLSRAGIQAKAIHGDKSQNARQNALKRFKEYKIPVLVATDIAARGIDINELPLVINFDLPNVPETYVHRIGRTGRAGQEGTALSFCDPSELPYLKDIEALTRVNIPALEPPAGISMAEAQCAARYVKHDPTLPPERPARSERSHQTKKRPHKAASETPNRRNQAELRSEKTVDRSKRGAAVQDIRKKQGTQKRGAVQNEGGRANLRTSKSDQRKKRYEPETRVDVMTPPTGRPLSPSTAARIRAKVEAKLAERAAEQKKKAAHTREAVQKKGAISAQKRQAGQKKSAQAHQAGMGKVQRKSQTRSGRGRARG